MSVTIVSTPPKMGPATSIDDSLSKLPDSSNAAARLDFASILLGQLPPTGRETLVSTDHTAQGKEGEANSTTPTDAIPLITALNLDPQTPEQGIGKNIPTSANTLSIDPSKSSTTSPHFDAQQGIPATAASVKSDDSAKAAPTEAPALVSTPGTDDKPAKFAVPVLAVADAVKESVTPKTLDTQPGTITPVANQAAHTNSAAPARTDALSLLTPIRDQNWATDFGQRIVWLANNNKQAAQLSLNPPQMGPIDISLNIEQGNATASFVSANADVREAIETAMPRLREMFASAGISLGQTNVSAESFKQQAGGENGNGSPSASWAHDNAILAGDASVQGSGRSGYVQRGNGMIDIFA